MRVLYTNCISMFMHMLMSFGCFLCVLTALQQKHTDNRYSIIIRVYMYQITGYMYRLYMYSSHAYMYLVYHASSSNLPDRRTPAWQFSTAPERST